MIDDEKRSGRLPIDDIDALVLEQFNKNPFYTVSTLSGSMGMSTPTRYRHLRD
jgi:hypothetical protein